MTDTATPSSPPTQPRQRILVEGKSAPNEIASDILREKHIPALDGVRGLAILMVLCTHFIPADWTTTASRLISKIGNAGWCGVDLFFVLSGFLITGILFDAKGSPGYFRNFYARRTIRIFPLYYGALLVTLLLLPAVWRSYADDTAQLRSHQWSLWLYCSNIDVTVARRWLFESRLVDMNHFWSLAVEEQFYLVWPLMVWFLGRRSLLGLCALACVTAWGLRYFWALDHNGMATYTMTPSRMDALAFGAAVALILRSPLPIPQIQRASRVLAVVSLGTMLHAFWHKRMWTLSDPRVATYGMVAMEVFFASALALLLISPQHGLGRRAFSAGWLRLLGKYSYGIYVFHALLQPDFDRWFSFESLTRALHSNALAQLAHFFILTAISIVIALLSWHLFEKHFLRLKKYFEYRKPSLPRDD